MSKKYYWLKLNENFFEREEIKIIEDMPNGKDYIIFYMKLLVKSIRTEGELLFRNIIPYTPEMLSSITNTDIDTVRVATDLFNKLDLLEIWDDGTLFMKETENMIGSETSAAKRMRKMREKDKGNEGKIEKRNNVTPKLPNVQNSYTEIEIDKEIDIELEIDKDKELEDKEEPSFKLTQSIKEEVIKRWNDLNLQKLRSINTGTARSNSLKARIEEYSLEEVYEVIDNIKKSSFLQGDNDRNWTITFDWLLKQSNFIKVLEGNYTDKKKKFKEENKHKTKFHNFEQQSEKYTKKDLDEVAKRKREEQIKRLNGK